MRSAASQQAQASAELVALTPVLIFAFLALAQVVATGWALLSAGEAARTAARIAHVGGDAEKAAGEALPDALEPGAVEVSGSEVEVEVRVPRVIPGLPGIPVKAAAALDPEAGP
jgi:hypothetical protein